MAANSTGSVTVKPATAANSLQKPGNYSSSLKVTNARPRMWIQMIPVTLQIEQSLTVSPLQGFSATGPVGGPFTPGSQSYVLTNLGSTTMKWGVVKSATWLTVSTASGSLAANAHTTVTVTIAAAANTLPAAAYTATVSFTNTAGLVATVPEVYVDRRSALSCRMADLKPAPSPVGPELWQRQARAPPILRNSTLVVHSGVYGVELKSAGAPGYLSQTMATVSGQTYLLSIWLHNPHGRRAQLAGFQLQWNGTPITGQQSVPTEAWTNYQFLGDCH